MDSIKEIKSGQELRDSLRAGVNKLADTVTLTLGPNGSTIILVDEFGEPYITKDGVSVSNKIHLEDPVENISSTLLKQVAQNTVEQAGDGTTTSIALAQAFINTGFDLLEIGTSYNKLRKQLEELEETIVAELIADSKELSKSDIINVATISANNDTKIGQLIQDAYDHSSIVKVEEGDDTKDKLVTISGMELPTGFFDNAFINNADKQSIDYKDASIILVDGKLDKLDSIGGILKQLAGPIIIMADHFSEQVVSIFKENYNRGALTVALVKSPGFGLHRKHLLKDIAIYTKATIVDPSTSKNDLHFGKLKSINITKSKCLISSDVNVEEVNKRIENLEKYLTTLPKGDLEIDLLEQRIENLIGRIAIIKAGGKSEVEMKERKDRIDDAVLAVNCALEEGIISGGGVALMHLYLQSAMLRDNPFADDISAPFHIIKNNGHNNVVATQEEMIEMGIIDPLKVTRVALQNAISVAKTILGTDAMVLDERLWK